MPGLALPVFVILCGRHCGSRIFFQGPPAHSKGRVAGGHGGPHSGGKSLQQSVFKRLQVHLSFGAVHCGVLHCHGPICRKSSTL